jgi:hypothetical protein
MGAGTWAMAVLLRTLRDVQPDPRASPERQAEARRSSREIQTLVVPWTRRIGLGLALIGVVLIAIDLVL